MIYSTHIPKIIGLESYVLTFYAPKQCLICMVNLVKE